MKNETLHRPTGFRIGTFPSELSRHETAVAVAWRGKPRPPQRSRGARLRRGLLVSILVLLAAAVMVELPEFFTEGSLLFGPRSNEGAFTGGPRLKVASIVRAQPSAQAPLPISILPRPPANGLLLISGLPSAITLSAGRMIATGQWLVPLAATSSLTMHVPAGMAGTAELTITLLGVEEPAAASQASARLVIAP